MNWQRKEWKLNYNKRFKEQTLTFSNEADLEKIIEMGFKVGFTSAHGNLDEVLEKNAAAIH